MGKPKRKYKSEADRKLWQLIEDLTNPIIIEWDLSDEDHEIISTYVDIFMREKKVDVLGMIVSEELHPKLHRFITALQGEAPWQETSAAYEYLEEHWPELKPLLDEDN